MVEKILRIWFSFANSLSKSPFLRAIEPRQAAFLALTTYRAGSAQPNHFRGLAETTGRFGGRVGSGRGGATRSLQPSHVWTAASVLWPNGEQTPCTSHASALDHWFPWQPQRASRVLATISPR
jgi:hypothetical protein